MDKKKVRCAIYTRKSSEEGLEQNFNSLDAQREACEAYIKSQMHEGWFLLDAKEYDTPEPNPYLVNAIVKSFYYHKQIQSGKTIEDLQTEEGLKDSKYIRNIMNLKYISPELTEQILNGTQPEELSLQRLIVSL